MHLQDVAIAKGPVVETILRFAQEHRTDIIAMPTAGHESFLDALRGSITERVLRHTPYPLLAIHAT
jgi:nucleotide-binding universal stress UspA family protein